MIELRWILPQGTTTEPAKFQYRESDKSDHYLPDEGWTTVQLEIVDNQVWKKTGGILNE